MGGPGWFQGISVQLTNTTHVAGPQKLSRELSLSTERAGRASRWTGLSISVLKVKNQGRDEGEASGAKSLKCGVRFCFHLNFEDFIHHDIFALILIFRSDSSKVM